MCWYKLACILYGLLLSGVNGFSQSAREENAADLMWADSIAETYKKHRVETSYSATIKELTRACAIYGEHRDTCTMAWLLGHLCNTYDVEGKLDSALITGQKAIQLFRPDCDSLKLMSITVFLTNVYLSLEQFDQVIALTEDALNRWNPQWEYVTSKDGLYTNRAIALAYLGRMDEALEAFRDVLRNAQEQKDPKLIREAYMNLGGMFGMLSNGSDMVLLDSAELYIFKALELIRTIDPEGVDMMTQYSNVASLKADRGQHRLSLIYIDSAYTIAERLGDLPMRITLLRNRSNNLLTLGNPSRALDELNTYITLKDSLMSLEKLKVIADMQEKYESEKKAGEIKNLTIQTLDSQLKEERATRARNITMISGIGVLIMAMGLWNRLKFTRKTKAIIEKEKNGATTCS